jgi:hypothetical protein
MRVKLNTDVQSMFPLLGLSFENPGPVEVDVAKLSSQQILWVNNAINKGVLISDSKPITPVTKAAALTVQAQTKKDQAKELLKSAEDERAQKSKQAETALKAAQLAVVPMIEGSNDLQLLRTMQDQELVGKARKKVLDALKVKITKLESTVGSIVGDPLDEKALLITDRNLKYLPEVEEEIEEEKTFTFKQE